MGEVKQKSKRKRGRKPILINGQRDTVYMSEQAREDLINAGGDNLSRGIRIAHYVLKQTYPNGIPAEVLAVVD